MARTETDNAKMSAHDDLPAAVDRCAIVPIGCRATLRHLISAPRIKPYFGHLGGNSFESNFAYSHAAWQRTAFAEQRARPDSRSSPKQKYQS